MFYNTEVHSEFVEHALHTQAEPGVWAMRHIVCESGASGEMFKDEITKVLMIRILNIISKVEFFSISSIMCSTVTHQL